MVSFLTTFKLQQRAAEWRATLRDEPIVARRLLRRLVGPLTLWDASEPEAAWIDWETVLTPALLEGLAPIQVVASPTGFGTAVELRSSSTLTGIRRGQQSNERSE